MAPKIAALIPEEKIDRDPTFAAATGTNGR